MSILITGGTGFLGAHLARHLVTKKGRTDVILFDRMPVMEPISDIAGSVKVVAGDVLEPQELIAIMHKHDIDLVVHLASSAGLNDPDKIVPFARLACMGTANVFEAARIHGVVRIAAASSIAAWGRPTEPGSTSGPIELMEDVHCPAPETLYGSCKVWAEHLAAIYNAQHGMEILSLRIPATMGRGRLNRASLTMGVMAPETVHFMAYPEMAAMGQSVTMPPDDQMVDVLYAADNAEAWWCALTAPKPEHAVFNVSAGHQPVGDMTRRMRELLPDADIRVSEEPLMAGPVMNNRRLVDELGFRPSYTIERAVEAYLDDVRQRGDNP
jgi:nucleoside-diphosphate-sugar epimerase